LFGVAEAHSHVVVGKVERPGSRLGRREDESDNQRGRADRKTAGSPARRSGKPAIDQAQSFLSRLIVTPQAAGSVGGLAFHSSNECDPSVS